jgi:hypothetical protein
VQQCSLPSTIQAVAPRIGREAKYNAGLHEGTWRGKKKVSIERDAGSKLAIRSRTSSSSCTANGTSSLQRSRATASAHYNQRMQNPSLEHTKRKKKNTKNEKRGKEIRQ